MSNTLQPRITRETFFLKADEYLEDKAVSSIGVLLHLPGEQGKQLTITDKADFVKKIRHYEHAYNDALEFRQNVFIHILDIIPFRIDLEAICRNGQSPTR